MENHRADRDTVTELRAGTRRRCREPMAAPENRYPNLQPGYVPAHRVGRNQRLARRAMIAAGSSTVTTAQLMAIIYPNKPWVKWRWTDVREAAERYGQAARAPPGLSRHMSVLPRFPARYGIRRASKCA